jgi:hypothetical protein
MNFIRGELQDDKNAEKAFEVDSVDPTFPDKISEIRYQKSDIRCQTSAQTSSFE